MHGFRKPKKIVTRNVVLIYPNAGQDVFGINVGLPLSVLYVGTALKGAGYNVLPVNALPAGVAKGIRLNSVAIELEEVNKLYKIETKCTVKITLEPWRNGMAIKTLNYENSYTDSTLIDRDLFLLKSLQTTLQELMARVVREVTVTIEQK